MNRDFFQMNSILNRNFQTPKNQDFQLKRFQSAQTLKRFTSCRDPSSSLNPQKFINRKVFNSKLYSAKPFNIAIEFNKQTQQKTIKCFSFNDNQIMILLKKKLRQQSYQELENTLKSIIHYFKTLNQLFDDAQPHQLISKSSKNQTLLLKEAFDKVLQVFGKEVSYFEKCFLQMKSKQLTLKNSKGFQTEKSFANQRKVNFQSKKFNESALISFIKPNQALNFKELASNSSLKSAKKNEDNFAASNTFKNLTNKLNLIEFENKKHILRIQSLQLEKNTKQKKINQLENEIKQMKSQIDKINEQEQIYNYKIKKLKEQLQVAHIVKEQNLAEKMKFILSL